MTHVTVHAEERFLQRVLKCDKAEITTGMKKRAGHWLSQEIDLTRTYLDGRYPLPSFPDYVAVIHNNSIVTIRPKN